MLKTSHTKTSVDQNAVDSLGKFLNDQLPLLLFWLLLGLFAGLVYSLEMIGLDGSMTLFSPERARSLHISQMLYGFFPLILSLLPFALFEREGVLSENALAHLRRYFAVWNTFLLFMSMALLFGNIRGLPFYDFPYQLNFLLAFSGVFYLLALVDALRRYEKRPLWVNVSLAVVVIAPVALVVLMNPQYGQVEQTLVGPHGDNTLGMSFALIPIYYLLIKLNAARPFVPRWKILWIIPLAGYAVSLIIRNFFHTLSYNEEWFFQYLTLSYLPLLWVWLHDAGVRFRSNPYLILSVLAFVFVDVEGNILFIPELRALIHRNDLVIGHAHLAMGLGVAFMGLSIAHRLAGELFNRFSAVGWALLISLMSIFLTFAGAIEAGALPGKTEWFWFLRSFAGAGLVALVLMLLYRRLYRPLRTPIEWYHLGGFVGDAGGGAVLLIAGAPLFGWLGFHFSGTYEYVVFAFMIGTGMVHWAGLQENTPLSGSLSATIRLIVSATFASLYMAGILDEIAILVALYDGAYGLLYWLALRDKK